MLAAALGVVLFLIDMSAGLVLSLTDAGALGGRHVAIGLGLALHLLNAGLLGLEPVILGTGQITRAEALLDALLLVGLTVSRQKNVLSQSGEHSCNRDH